MKKNKRVFTLVYCLVFCCLSCFFGTNFAFAQVKTSENKSFEILKNLEIFGSAYGEIEKNYVDDVKSGELIQKALDAMMETLDPYTVYIPEANIEDYKILTMGQYGGIGSMIHWRDNNVYISEPYEGFPADKAGLKPGDKIVSVNGQDTKGRTVSDVSALLKGQAGTPLDLTIERSGESKLIQVRMMRQEIKIDNVTYSGVIGDKIGYIRLDGFTQSAGEEVKNTFLALKKQEIKGLILDLRYNGGGLLGEAVKIVNFFYKRGVPVVSTKGKVEDKNSTFYTTESPLDTEIPIVILTSRGTASASEIVSGALQDYDRAVVLGERTFGKGLVQNILPLPYNAQIKVTVSKYYIPSGRCVQAIDYSHKDQEGRAPKIPDSLRTAFKTAGGRVVYDGDGIEPDLEREFPISSYALASLITQYHIFDYANKYKTQNSSIGSVDSFKITDKIYEDFLQFMKTRDYNYKLGSETLLSEIEKRLQADSCFEAVKDAYLNLKEKIVETKKKDFAKEKENIKSLLFEEIVSRYYYQKGRAKAELKNDTWIDEAVKLLKNKEEYNKILKP